MHAPGFLFRHESFTAFRSAAFWHADKLAGDNSINAHAVCLSLNVSRVTDRIPAKRLRHPVISASQAYGPASTRFSCPHMNFTHRQPCWLPARHTARLTETRCLCLTSCAARVGQTMRHSSPTLKALWVLRKSLLNCALDVSGAAAHEISFLSSKPTNL